MSNMFPPIPGISFEGPRDFSPEVEIPKTTDSHIEVPWLTPLSSPELMASEQEVVVWLIDHYVPIGGICLLSGASGIGKTWLLLHLVECVLRGIPFLGTFETKQASVLMIDEENRKSLLKTRLTMIGHEPTETLQLLIRKGVSITNPETIDALLTICAEHNIRLVTIDSLVRVHGGDENDARSSDLVYKQMMRLSEAGIAVIAIAHHRKPNGFGAAKGDMLRGSSDFKSAADIHLILEREDEAGIVRLIQDKNRMDAEYPDQLISIEISAGFTTFNLIALPDPEEITRWVEAAILEVLATQPETSQASLIGLIIEAVPGSAEKQIVAIAKRMERDGTIDHRKGSRGSHLYYIPTDEV